MDFKIIKNNINQIEDEKKRKFFSEFITKLENEKNPMFDLVSFSNKLFNLAKLLQYEQIEYCSKRSLLTQWHLIDSLLLFIPDDQVVEKVISK